jgi:hypothetical protein
VTTMFEAWLLYITMNGVVLLGGEYQTEERCVLAAVAQMEHWRTVSKDASWRCEKAKE